MYPIPALLNNIYFLRCGCHFTDRNNRGLFVSYINYYYPRRLLNHPYLERNNTHTTLSTIEQEIEQKGDLKKRKKPT